LETSKKRRPSVHEVPRLLFIVHFYVGNTDLRIPELMGNVSAEQRIIAQGGNTLNANGEILNAQIDRAQHGTVQNEEYQN